MPRTVPRACGQTGTFSCEEESCPASGAAAHAVGMPLASPCLIGGKTYLAPWTRNSSSAASLIALRRES